MQQSKQTLMLAAICILLEWATISTGSWGRSMQHGPKHKLSCFCACLVHQQLSFAPPKMLSNKSSSRGNGQRTGSIDVHSTVSVLLAGAHLYRLMQHHAVSHFCSYTCERLVTIARAEGWVGQLQN